MNLKLEPILEAEHLTAARLWLNRCVPDWKMKPVAEVLYEMPPEHAALVVPEVLVAFVGVDGIDSDVVEFSMNKACSTHLAAAVYAQLLREQGGDEDEDMITKEVLDEHTALFRITLNNYKEMVPRILYMVKSEQRWLCEARLQKAGFTSGEIMSGAGFSVMREAKALQGELVNAYLAIQIQVAVTQRGGDASETWH